MSAGTTLPPRARQRGAVRFTLAEGHWSRLEPLAPEAHAAALFAAMAADPQGRLWTYMTYGPFDDEAALQSRLERLVTLPGRDFHAIIDQGNGRAAGFLALVRPGPSEPAIELGHVVFSPVLQRTRGATEAIFLLLCKVFEQFGCRRIAWRADRCNQAGLRAALRFGFRAEALARQDSHYKGRNRDTWWLSILADEWPALKAAYEHWLRAENFDPTGRQRSCLSDFTARQGGDGRSFGASSQAQVDLSPPAPALYPQGRLQGERVAMKEPRVNELGQPIGEPLPDWSPRPPPPRTVMEGRWCRVEPLDPAHHAESLHEAKSRDTAGRNWTYLPVGPFPDFAAYRAWLEEVAAAEDPLFHAIVEGSSGRALGVASYLRLQPELGVIEVGHIHFSPEMQRNRLATEAMYLMMRRVFDELGYRRYEWKCDALNSPSRRAAERLGFTYEGTFRQAILYKGRNRDTAWYSIIDEEWPALKAAFDAWLAPSNFDSQGQQKRSLASFRQG